MKKHDWTQAHAERWSRSNHKFMHATPRVTRESLQQLDRQRRTLDEVADTIIMVACVITVIALGTLAIADKAGWLK